MQKEGNPMKKPTIGNKGDWNFTPEPGAHLYVRRRLGYTHHGIAVSATSVIHFNGEPGSKSGATIRRCTFEEFADGGKVKVREYGERLNPEETIALAESKLGTSGYDLFHDNCEHFARWCVSGQERSQQVDSATATGLAACTSVAGAAGSAYAVSAVGFTGTSGAGILSGLAGIGFGGVTGGLVTLAVLPAATAVGVMHVGLRDHEDLPASDRKARSDGRRATVAAAAATTAAVVPTVSMLGTAGLSGAGLASGLATAGSIAGGGMLAGSVLLAAAPAAAVCGVGLGTYAIAKKIRRTKTPKPEAAVI